MTNKKVAVIGSGASAAQVIPAIADKVKELNVFQRTPHWVLPRHDRKFSKFQQKLLGYNWIYKLIRKQFMIGPLSENSGFNYL